MDFEQGYFYALRDLLNWITNPAAPLDKRLLYPKVFPQVLKFIIKNRCEFAKCPTAFCFDFEVDNKEETNYKGECRMKKVFVSVAVRGLNEEQTVAKHAEYKKKITDIAT